MAKILVVDDELVLRELMKDFLETAGHKVETAETGMQGLEKLRAGGFQMLVCDVNMPGLSGVELLRLVRSDPAFKTLPVLMCTARDTMGEVDLAFEIGANGYVVKPFNLKSLTESVSKAFAAKA
jgi:two-component system, chemotaxis family, chemotaxis protein CheY